MMRIVWVADYFKDDLLGGAELSLDALQASCPYPQINIRCKDFNLANIDPHSDFVIFGNFKDLQISFMLDIQHRRKYAVIEHDFKYCLTRSPQAHAKQMGKSCECQKGAHADRIFDFYANAKLLFWKSDRQRNMYYGFDQRLLDVDGGVIGCNFTDDDLNTMAVLRTIDKNDRYAVLKTPAWIKGSAEAVDFCKEHGFKYTEIGNMKYADTLKALSRCKGLVYLPNGFDTCPRMTVEAKLMGLEVIANDNVMHRDEKWFDASPDAICEHIRSKTELFWGKVKAYAK